MQITRIIRDTIVATTDTFNWPLGVEIRKKIHAFVAYEPHTKSFSLDLSQIIKGYINGLMPVIAEIVRLREEGFEITVIEPTNRTTSDYFRKMGWLHYLCPDRYDESGFDSLGSFPMQRFRNDEELNDLVSKAVRVCLEQLRMEEGTPQAFEWSINEIAGNVLVHSGRSEGYIQVITYPKSHSLAIGVCDSGIGIPASMRSSFPNKTDEEELQLAITQGVTSNPKNGQGNGLAGTIALAEASEGSISIVSGSAFLTVLNNRTTVAEGFPPFVGTFVDVQFSTDKPVDLPKALWGHTPVDMLELSYEDDKGASLVSLRDLASSFGNRITGAKIRNMIMNLLTSNPGKPVRVLMTGVGIVSSSFADEVFGKIMVELGPIDFGNLIKLEDVNPTCRSIINRTIAQRLAQSINE